ncbi:MAG: UDP-3-O-(3-hydroxymyristoyl)glucosamine N-acyltransferase [Deltaproteobacteria bacterium]|nr:UDP-3-O-(3-hydroxymyristoyl)glucosamine N-acyltransferase [Deltaproteobacteria bacterium]
MAIQKTLEELAAITGGRIAGDAGAVITGVASIEDARPGEIAFIAGKARVRLLKTTRAGAVIVKEGACDAPGQNLLLVKNPQIAFAAVMDALRPACLPAPGIHPRAEVHPGARVGAEASVGAFAVVEDGAVIGECAIIYAGVYVGPGARIGARSIIYPGVAIREGCLIGERVIIHCNSVVGSDGFGYAFDEGRFHKLPQRGIVRIEDDVEIGACVTIDRAAIAETVIGRGTKIDNLVQIAHNVTVGPDSVIVAQAGVAGSTHIGGHAQIGGQAGVAGHLTIGDGVMIGAQSGVTADLSPGAWSGSPAQPHSEWLRSQAIYAKLPELKKRVAELEKRIKELEEKR